MRWQEWVVLAGLVSACTSEVGRVDEPDETISPRDAFDEAEATWEVPAELLMSIAMGETGMQMVVGEEEFEGWAPAFGVMALRGESLERGAELAGFSVEQVRVDRRANVLAAAALLRSWADEVDLRSMDADDWAPLVARYSGLEGEEARTSYVWDQVYSHLQRGFSAEGIEVEPRVVLPAWERPAPPRLQAADRSYAVWRPSPNYSSRSGYTPQIVVIHSCEGAYAGCWGWLNNSTSGVSAHYVVNESGSEVSQLVNESNKAWHVGASYDCSLNGSQLCNRNGLNVNYFSVGIEHAGYANQASWSSGLLAKSAQLTCDITRTHNIPRDSYHIVAHGRLQPYNRVDPGPNWPWTDYLNRVNTACGAPAGGGGAPAPTTQFVIDSNNSANNTAKYYVSVSNTWWSSTSTPGYYNSGYWVGPVAAVSDPARFYFKETSSQCYKVEAWWTAGTNRSAAAPFIAYNASGTELGRRNMNQQANGGRWNTVGTWRFTSGWNQVILSRWTNGTYVIADAVRLTSSTACP
ncbi:MAG TPA: N-acetylmuramoyl-L-alanine amidase [Myxococcota bacterium]|nr:N-acetylmuramoyl-L-alanine amidase [Myxococcota bacterium]